MKKLIVAACSFSASVALLGGAVSAASISTTGPGSYNKISVKNVNVCKVKTNNNVNVMNFTTQSAKTGSASVKHNTTGGDATSGDAANTATNTVNGTLNNNTACPELAVAPVVDGSVDTTGPGSSNVIKSKNVSKVKVTTNNNISVGNVVVQGASSGNASVWGNTTGGDAMSGDASNSSSSVVTLTVNNN